MSIIQRYSLISSLIVIFHPVQDLLLRKLARVLHKRDVRIAYTLAHEIVRSVAASAAVVGHRSRRNVLDTTQIISLV
jgi:DUF971 family protein